MPYEEIVVAADSIHPLQTPFSIRCGENVKGLSASQIDLALSSTILTIGQHLSETPLDINR